MQNSFLFLREYQTQTGQKYTLGFFLRTLLSNQLCRFGHFLELLVATHSALPLTRRTQTERLPHCSGQARRVPRSSWRAVEEAEQVPALGSSRTGTPPPAASEILTRGTWSGSPDGSRSEIFSFSINIGNIWRVSSCKLADDGVWTFLSSLLLSSDSSEWCHSPRLSLVNKK